MYKDLMDKLMLQQDLSQQDLFQMISDVVTETMTAVQIMGFQMAFLMKEPTAQELAWYVQAMQAHCRPIPIGGTPILDIAIPGEYAVASAVIAAAAGLPVVKQVRSDQTHYVSSQPVLQQLGIAVAQEPETAARQCRQCSAAFVQARAFHPALERTLNEQTEAQIRALLQTVIGPLSNPAGATRYVWGVQDAAALPLLQDMVEALENIQVLLLCGDDRSIPVILQDSTRGLYWDGRSWHQPELLPAALGLRPCPAALLQTDAESRLPELLTGTVRDVRRDVLLANAGAALWVGGKAADLTQGIALAASLIDSGKAAGQLALLRSFRPD